MIIEKLKGHSGCKLSLHKKRGLSFIRKKSPTFEYNLRLKKQCEKQLNWNKEISFVPRVLDTGYDEGLFYFDMEYILGSTISSLISEDQMDIEEVIQYIISYFKYQNHIKKKSKTIANKYLTKMRDLNNLKIRFSFMKNLNEALFLLNDNCWFPEYKTVVHGDLTLENLIKSKLDGKIYMIDFLPEI